MNSIQPNKIALNPPSIERRGTLEDKKNYSALGNSAAPMEIDPKPAPGESFCKPYRFQNFSEKGILTDEEHQIFADIFSQLATKSYWGLLKNKWNLDKLKDQVSHIHPLNALVVVKSDPALKADFLKGIKKWPVWSNCKSAFKEEIKDQHKFQNILPYLRDFSEKMSLDYHLVSSYMQKDKYEDLVLYILQNNN